MALREKHIIVGIAIVIIALIAILVFKKNNPVQSPLSPSSSAPVISETNLVFLSPHNDDTILTFGGLLLNHQGFPHQEKNVMVFFNVSNYAANEIPEKTQKRIKKITLERFTEDMDALAQIFNGIGNYTYTLQGQKDALLREHTYARNKDFTAFNPQDIHLFEQTYEKLRVILQQPDCALFVPSALGGHLDHFILREAVIRAAYHLQDYARCQIYFGEDQPYVGQAPKKTQAQLEKFITRLNLHAYVYPIDVNKKIELFVNNYQSQFKDSYVLALHEHTKKVGGERIYLWPREQYGHALTDPSCEHAFCQLF